MVNRSFKSFLLAESGVAAIEMAMILPFLLFLYFGLLDLTGLVSFNRKITSVSNAMADLTAQNRNSILKASVNDYMSVASMIMDPTPTSNVTVKVYGYRLSGGTATKIWTVSNGTGPGCASAPSTATMPPLMVSGNDLVVAQACMKYEPYVATFMGDKILGATSFDVEQTIIVRPRSSLKLDCYATVVGGAVCS